MSKKYLQAPTTPEHENLFNLRYRVWRDENRNIFATAPDGRKVYYGQSVDDAWIMCDVHSGTDPAKYQKHQNVSIVGASGKIKLYFAGSIRGGRVMQPFYAHIIQYLQNSGYEVLSEHVGSELSSSGETLDETTIYQRDIAWINEADAVIADVTVPSLGVGYEVAYAQFVAKKSVLCVAQSQTNVSAMIKGSGVKLLSYDHPEHLEATVDWWLDKFKRGELL